MSEPLITLTTDFGEGSAYVAAMKGAIYSIIPSVRIVDISHRVAPQDVRMGALMLEDATRWFPPGTIHVAVIDPGVGTERPIVFAEIGKQRYIAPDNGLLSRITLHEPASRIIAVENPRYWHPVVSETFHGRDIMGPVAAHVASGIDPADLGTALSKIHLIEWPQPQETDHAVTGEIIAVDHFGNLISNITTEHLGAGDRAALKVTCGGRTLAGLRRTYGEEQPGTLVALVGSTERLEVAVVDGNASRELGLGVGGLIRVDR